MSRVMFSEGNRSRDRPPPADFVSWGGEQSHEHFHALDV
jgi:hypothetical protein